MCEGRGMVPDLFPLFVVLVAAVMLFVQQKQEGVSELVNVIWSDEETVFIPHQLTPLLPLIPEVKGSAREGNGAAPRV